MEEGCGSNSHVADGIDELLCLLKRIFPGKSSSCISTRLDEPSPPYRPQDCKFKKQVQKVTMDSFTFLDSHLLVVVLFSPFCEVQVVSWWTTAYVSISLNPFTSILWFGAILCYLRIWYIIFKENKNTKWNDEARKEVEKAEQKERNKRIRNKQRRKETHKWTNKECTCKNWGVNKDWKPLQYDAVQIGK
jgi:hypothetical protein